MKAWTDYPFASLDDAPGQQAPIREVDVLSYDGNKYCRILVKGYCEQVKAGYLYQRPGRAGEVPSLTRRQLSLLEDSP